MYVVVTLRNVSSWSRLECQFALMVRNDSGITDTQVHEDVDRDRVGGEGAGQCFLAMEEREDSTAGPSQRTYLEE